MRHPLISAATLALLATSFTVGVTLTRDPVSAAPPSIYVSPGGSDANSGGSTGSALRTIGEAVRIAAPDATILIADGTYHESVQVFDKKVHLRARGSKAVLDGARRITNWTREPATDRWYTTGWTPQFPRNDSIFVDADHPEAAYADQVFVNGAPLDQVTSRNAVTSTTFFHDEGADRLYIGVDPAGRRVEASALAWGLYLNGADGSTVTGLAVQRYATPSRDLAALRAHANDVTLTAVTVRDNAFNGISVIGRRVSITDSVVRSNGHTGVHGHQSSDVSIERSDIFDNNAARFDATHAAAGTKFTNSDHLRFVDNTVRGNSGPGIWTDISSHDIDVVSNRIEDNARAGIELELSARADVIDNIVRRNHEAGIYVLESNDVRVWHNLATDNARDIWALQGNRSSSGLPSGVLWELDNVSIRANAVGGSGRGEEALLATDDWTENRSAASMDVSSDANTIWYPKRSTADQALRWAMWPSDLVWTSSLPEFRSRTGNDGTSKLVTDAANPYERGAPDYTPIAGAPTGPALPDSLAQLVGVGSGSRHPAGPISAAWTEVPSGFALEQAATAGSTADRTGRRFSISP